MSAEAQPTESAEALDEVLARHRLHASMNICTGCDWRPTQYAGMLADQHEAHLAAALLASEWMKRHDAEVRAEAWERGNNDGLTFAAAPQKSLLTNPYLAALTEEGGD